MRWPWSGKSGAAPWLRIFEVSTVVGAVPFGAFCFAMVVWDESMPLIFARMGFAGMVILAISVAGLLVAYARTMKDRYGQY